MKHIHYCNNSFACGVLVWFVVGVLWWGFFVWLVWFCLVFCFCFL